MIDAKDGLFVDLNFLLLPFAQKMLDIITQETCPCKEEEREEYTTKNAITFAMAEGHDMRFAEQIYEQDEKGNAQAGEGGCISHDVG